MIEPEDRWEPWPSSARVVIDGNVFSIFYNDPEDTEHMPRKAPVGFTAEIPPVEPLVSVRDLSPTARRLAKHNGWSKRQFMTTRLAAAYEKTVRLKTGDQ